MDRPRYLFISEKQLFEFLGIDIIVHNVKYSGLNPCINIKRDNKDNNKYNLSDLYIIWFELKPMSPSSLFRFSQARQSGGGPGVAYPHVLKRGGPHIPGPP